jgi:integrase
MARNEKGGVKVADNLYRRADSSNLYIIWHQGGRKRWKSTKTSLLKEAKRLRDELLARVRASGLTRDERVTYEEIRQIYIDHCTVCGRTASLQTFLDARAKHLDQFFRGMRVVEIAQSGAIGRYIAERKREAASNASVNRETQILGQMFRLAADDEHRLISRGLVPHIRKLEEPPPRQGIVTEKQFAEIVANLPAWAVAPIKAINITGWRVRAVLSRRITDVDLESGFLILDRESSKNRTAYKWPLVGDLGELVLAQIDQTVRDERSLRCVIPWLFHRGGKAIPYDTLHDTWREATRAAGYPGKLLHDFRRTAATRLDSTPGISRSVAMALLGHKTDIMFRRYVQTHDRRLIEAANALARHRSAEMANGDGDQNGTNSVAVGVELQGLNGRKANKIKHLEEEGARWPHRSSKPAWQLLRLPEGSTPSPLRQLEFAGGLPTLAEALSTPWPYSLGRVANGGIYGHGVDREPDQSAKSVEGTGVRRHRGFRVAYNRRRHRGSPQPILQPRSSEHAERGTDSAHHRQ